VPRNPVDEAREKGVKAERAYRVAVKQVDKTLAARKRAMLACRKAGVTLGETGRIFGVSDSAVSNVVAELGKA
jgi:DNA-directed RNA polymerase specialized sigma subunit